ncbi:MAG: BON domain-containing protein [Steroidobacteraceae bacterium]
MDPSLKASATIVRPSTATLRKLGIAAVAIATLLNAGCAFLRGHEVPSAYVDDSSVTARIKTALIKSPGIKASEIDVHTDHGVVTLDGVVDNEQMLQRAERIARDTQGVASVRNTLQVARTHPLAELR